MMDSSSSPYSSAEELLHTIIILHNIIIMSKYKCTPAQIDLHVQVSDHKN